MQATGAILTPTGVASPPVKPRAYAAQDQFTSLLQGRMVGLLAQPGGPGPAAAAGLSSRPGAKAASGGAAFSPGQQAELISCLMHLGVPQDQAKAWIAAACQRGAQGAGEETEGAREMPPLLQSFLATLEQAPGQALAVPPSRRPEVAALLVQAGLPAAQVDRLLSSPGIQEAGLTAQDVQAAWSRHLRGTAAPGADIAPSPAAALTAHPSYRRLWARLAVPAAQFQDLKTALQSLGAPPEALAGLEEQAAQGPIPLSKVWPALAQPRPEPAAAAAAPTAPPPEPAAAPDPNVWLKLLVQSGMPAQVAQTLLGGGEGPGGNLKARLLALAPSPEAPAGLTEPKPLYLPRNLRLRFAVAPGEEENGGRRFGAGQDLGGSPSSDFRKPAVSGSGAAAVLEPKSAAFPGVGGEPPAPALPTAAGASGPPAAAPFLPAETRESVWTQIHHSVLANLRQGENRVTLQLNPPELGEVHLTLNLKGQFLQVTAVATRPEAAHLAGAEVQQLVQSLGQQGLILSQFQVQIQDPAGKSPPAVASGQRASGRRDGEAGPRGEALPRRRSRGLDFFV